MGLNLTTDLVVDVMRAAEPQKRALAASRLGATSENAQASASRETGQIARAKAHQDFEAAMLRTFTEQMMPKETSSLYGEGTAANIWRSLQVDLMSQQIAKSGGIGIAKMLDRVPTSPEHTAQSLGLNEMLGAKQRTELLSSVAQWPYFASITEGNAG